MEVLTKEEIQEELEEMAKERLMKKKADEEMRLRKLEQDEDEKARLESLPSGDESCNDGDRLCIVISGIICILCVAVVTAIILKSL